MLGSDVLRAVCLVCLLSAGSCSDFGWVSGLSAFTLVLFYIALIIEINVRKLFIDFIMRREEDPYSPERDRKNLTTQKQQETRRYRN